MICEMNSGQTNELRKLNVLDGFWNKRLPKWTRKFTLAKEHLRGLGIGYRRCAEQVWVLKQKKATREKRFCRPKAAQDNH